MEELIIKVKQAAVPHGGITKLAVKLGYEPSYIRVAIYRRKAPTLARILAETKNL